jgi:hypothetical protein
VALLGVLVLASGWMSGRPWAAAAEGLPDTGDSAASTQVPPQVTAAATGSTEPLLLIHGYGDKCAAAFAPETLVANPGQPPLSGPPAGPVGLSGAGQALSAAGFGRLVTVGYYSSEVTGQGCADWVVNTADRDDVGACDSITGASAAGTTGEPIRHLACRLAWYVYDTYTRNNQPVRILAHSMGGLIVRDAIAEAGHGAPFPPALAVDRVVTVATPHGGLANDYLANARTMLPSAEVEDMAADSPFMARLNGAGYQAPQGTGGTFWGLLGGSQSCNPSKSDAAFYTMGTLVQQIHPSCNEIDINHSPQITGPTSGDGIIQASSQLGMKADVKVLYGMVDYNTSDGLVTTYTADSATQYGHEWGTGTTLWLGTQAYVPGPFYLNDAGTAATRAWVCDTSCTSTASVGPLADMGVNGPAQTEVRALPEIIKLLSTPAFTVGHARNAGNDYPYDGLGVYDHQALTDPWHEYDGQCDSFAAWKVYENLGGAARADPATIPNASFAPADSRSISPIVGYAGAGAPSSNWGDARDWGAKAQSSHYAVDDRPSPGSIAWWSSTGTGMPVGHVGYVTDVYPDGSVTIEGYNLRANGQYSTIHMGRAGADDTSFGLAAWHVVWPSGFIHIGDTAANISGPPQPSPSPGYRYPHNTYGPGDAAPTFSLSGSPYPSTVDGWYSDAGHGLLGRMLWTNTHEGAADSTASWSPALAGNQCYQVDVFVPDNWSNNAAALYSVTDAHFGTSLVPVDENTTTNDWVELGVFQAGGGTIPVRLTDQGAETGQVAADGVRFVRQPSCSGLVRASQTVGYGSGLSLAGTSFPGTTNGWYASPGAGQLGSQYYTYTNGLVASSYATWSASLIPNACYELFAYVPDNHANDLQALYTIGTGAGNPNVSIDENAYTNAFAGLGTYRSTSGGTISVILTDQSLATGDAYVAADTLSFVHVNCPSAVEGADYPALTAGPGSPLQNFSLGSDWYNRFGHGYRGYEKWTNTHGSTAVSTATWTLAGLPPNTTYSVCMFIPDNYANNPSAHYRGYAGGVTNPAPATPTFTTLLNQANLTGWTFLGVLNSTTAGRLSVVLDDTGPTGTYTAADALRLTTGTC